jgi:small subunit ribosomal protein S7
MRKARAKKALLAPDPRYGEPLVTRFVNTMMWNGKKSNTFRIFYDAMDIIEKQTKEKPLEVWKRALNNVMPSVEVRSRRIGGATFQIPQEIRADRKISVTMKWIIGYARDRKGQSMARKLAFELIAASKNEGNAVKKKEDTHKMAEANKAFAHFRT